MGTLFLAVTACKARTLPRSAIRAEQPAGNGASPLLGINHIVVIYLENHSFDSLFGLFPGAENLDSEGAKVPQMRPVKIDGQDVPYPTLPQSAKSRLAKKVYPNAPFQLEETYRADEKIPDLTHLFWHEQMQINGGKMDHFVAYSSGLGLTMGYYDTTKLAVYSAAREFTVADHFFHAAFGGSFLNHIWLIAARTPEFKNPPTELLPTLDPETGMLALDAEGNIINDGKVTSDGYVVNTSFSAGTPGNPLEAEAKAWQSAIKYAPAKADVDMKPGSHLVPPQDTLTIGDLLSAKGVSWSWYSGGWNDAVRGKPAEDFQYHHQPFTYFKNFAAGTAMRAEHLRDEQEFFAAADAGTLPAVAYVEPEGEETEHPGYATLAEGDGHTLQLINAVRNGPNWKDTAIIVTYDENGGLFDHVAPPTTAPYADRFGPGSRVPLIVISPLAKKGYVDQTPYDTTSILAMIENRFDLPSLAERDRAMRSATEPYRDLRNAFIQGQAGLPGPTDEGGYGTPGNAGE